MEIEVCPLAELPPGTMKLVSAGPIAIGVYNCGGNLYALEDRCSHDDGPLCEGDWEADGNDAPPSLFGEEFMLVPSPNRYGLPDFYALHVWIGKHNPSGMFAMWNPLVHCPAA